MSQYSPEEGQFIVTALGIGCALSFLVPILVEAVNWYLDLGLHFEVAFTAWLLADLWTFPTGFYLLYHPVTLPLPTWLTFGHPVTFGGIAPNVCHNPTLTLEVKPPGGWPCFPAHLKDRAARLAGPEGWKYLIHLDAELILCLFCAVLNFGLITFLMRMIRKPRFDPKRARETCRHCGQKKVGTKSGEKSDCEKQQ
jgi:hypothetical protein